MFARLDRQQETLQKQQELLQVLATIFQWLPLLLGDAAGRWGCERDQTGDPVNQSDCHWKVISDYPCFLGRAQRISIPNYLFTFVEYKTFVQTTDLQSPWMGKERRRILSRIMTRYSNSCF